MIPFKIWYLWWNDQCPEQAADFHCYVTTALPTVWWLGRASWMKWSICALLLTRRTAEWNTEIHRNIPKNAQVEFPTCLNGCGNPILQTSWESCLSWLRIFQCWFWPCALVGCFNFAWRPEQDSVLRDRFKCEGLGQVLPNRNRYSPN